MRDNEGFHPLRVLLRSTWNIFLFGCVLIAGFTVIGYVAGWIEFRRDAQHDKAIIEIETGKAKEAARHAVNKSHDLATEAGHKVEKFAEQHLSTHGPKPEGTEQGTPTEPPKNAAGDNGLQRR